METVILHACIDRRFIFRHTAWEVIEPVSWLAAMTDGPAEFERVLSELSPDQRRLLALTWYRPKVESGGHARYYASTAGRLWREALEGFRCIGLDQLSELVEESSQLMGGEPSKSRSARVAYLDALEPDFTDLDERFKALIDTVDFDEAMTSYTRENPEAFLFEGLIEKPDPG